MNMTTSELKRLYLDFFRQKGHIEIPSASLIPENDPSALFTMAGMHPLVPYLMGEKHPQGKRLVNCQKCIRTVDIEEVGDQWHLTFFEMLGNWSLGDYWKKEAITWSYEFLIKELKIDPNKLAVTVFAGNEGTPFDQESYNLWLQVGIPKERIYKYGSGENWWGPVGETGPCGPCTEMFYITEKESCGPSCEPKCQCGKYVEIWNDVFMEYNKKLKAQNLKLKTYIYEPLKQKNVDTGMGVERTVAILNGYKDNYQVDTLKPIIEQIEKISGLKYQDNKKVFRIITDHVRAATFILGDENGVIPSNLDQGYILRRLIRRAIRYAKLINIKRSIATLTGEVVKLMGKEYPIIGLPNNNLKINSEFYKEEEKFNITLGKGLNEMKKIIRTKKKKGQNLFTGKEVFLLFSTYGFPYEMIKEIAEQNTMITDEKNFQVEFKKHQRMSRAGATQRFKGGIAEVSEETKKLHTATHLLQAALRQVLGDHVYQKGSNITTERLRFDFPHPEKITNEELQKVEQLVNQWIKQGIEVKCEEIPYIEAKKRHIIGVFTQKYDNLVKVYQIGNLSAELCGGPHVKNTRELGQFKIKKQESVGSGIRRIKAILI